MDTLSDRRAVAPTNLRNRKFAAHGSFTSAGPSGHGAAGVRGRADDGDLKQRIAAVATYASTSGGDHFIDVLVGLGEATAQTSVVLAGVPVTVETVIWTRRPGRRRLRQADAEDIVISALADAKQPVRVRRWDGTRFRVA